MAWNLVFSHLIWIWLTTSEPLAFTVYGLFSSMFTINTLLVMWFRFYYISYYRIGFGTTNKYEKHKLSVASKVSMAKAG